MRKSLSRFLAHHRLTKHYNTGRQRTPTRFQDQGTDRCDHNGRSSHVEEVFRTFSLTSNLLVITGGNGEMSRITQLFRNGISEKKGENKHSVYWSERLQNKQKEKGK